MRVSEEREAATDDILFDLSIESADRGIDGDGDMKCEGEENREESEDAETAFEAEEEVEGRDVVGTLRLELKEALALVDESKGEVGIAVELMMFTGEEEEEEE